MSKDPELAVLMVKVKNIGSTHSHLPDTSLRRMYIFELVRATEEFEEVKMMN